MNSEPWRDPLQELWQKQPAPVPIRDADRILRDVRTAQEEWEREWGALESAYISGALIMAGPELLHLLLSANRDWQDVVIYAAFGWPAIVAIVFRWRRRSIERAYGESLLARFARMRVMLRERIFFDDLTMLTLPLLALLAGWMIWDMTGWMPAAVAVAGVTLATLAWLYGRHRRRYRARLKQRLALLEQMSAEFSADPENGMPRG